MTSAERSLARRYFEDLFTAGDAALTDVILSPDITFDGPIHPAGIRGLPAFKVFVQAWYQGFPDRRFEVLEEWVEPERIATVFRVTGTHRGEFLGQAAAGNAVDMTAMNCSGSRAVGSVRSGRSSTRPSCSGRSGWRGSPGSYLVR